MEDREHECREKVIARKKALGIYNNEMYNPTAQALKAFRRKPYSFGRTATEVDE